jgi:mitochondrial enoyl-[acyl-carrier protein] reductase / trans-2-enoyl-CoA reductase
VLTRTLAAPINPADVNTIQGTYGSLPPFYQLLGTAEPSVVPGNEGCLEVVSVGSAVAGLKRGDWAIPAANQFGTWRTHALVENPEKALIRIDLEGNGSAQGGSAERDSGGHAGLTPIQVATVSVNPTSAYRMLRDYVDLVALSVQQYRSDSSATGGAWFIQNGANSGVGRAAIQLGRIWGLRSINVIRERENAEETEALKRELTELGATIIVTEAEFLDRSFRQRMAQEITRGGRESLMLGLNCVGGKSALNIAKSLSPGGTIVTYGGMARQPVSLPTSLLIFKDLRFRGFWLSRWAGAHADDRTKTIHEILGLMRNGEIRKAPVQEVKWDWETDETSLKDAVQGTLEGQRKGKGVFVFGDT